MDDATQLEPTVQQDATAGERPTATFRGNAYDLTALAALASGLLMLFSCLTCNMIWYCLPLAPLAMGAIGLLAAAQSVDTKRTRLWSWIGLGTGGVAVLLILAAVVIYIAFVILMIAVSDTRYY